MTSFVVSLAILTIVSGCTLVDEIGVETFAIERSGARYKTLLHQRTDTSYRFDFVADKNQLILADMGNVDVIDLETGARIMNREIPDAWIETVYVSKDQTKLYLFTTRTMQLWDTKDWRLLKELKAGEFYNERARFSKDETLLFFAGTLWSNDSFERIYEIGNGPSLTDAAFSPDNRYFVDTDHHAATPVIDVEKREWTGVSYKDKRLSQLSFRDNSSFFAGYGDRFDVPSDSFFPTALGVFSAKEEDRIESFSPWEMITCWVHDPDYGVLVSLYNGDIYLLDNRLAIRFKWHMNDFARSCVSAKPGEIWLGGDNTGIYRADLASKRITHEYKAGNPIHRLKLSSDGRYLGFVESMTGESMVTVLTPVPNRIERR